MNIPKNITSGLYEKCISDSSKILQVIVVLKEGFDLMSISKTDSPTLYNITENDGSGICYGRLTGMEIIELLDRDEIEMIEEDIDVQSL